MRLAVLVAIAACGDSVSSPDAPALGDASGGLVRVQVSGDERAGLTTVFQARDSRTVLATVTDAEGRANAFMDPDGFVTVAQHQGSTVRLFTYAGVQPGDDLHVALEGSAADVASFRLRVARPPDGIVDGLHTECGARDILGSDHPAGLEVVLVGCPPMTDMVVTAQGERTTYLHAEDVNVRGGLVVLDGTYQELATATATITNVPKAVPRVLVTQSLAAGAAELYADPAPELFETSGVALTATAMLPLPPAGTLRTTVTPLDAPGALHVVDWRPATTTVTLDLDERRVREQTSTPRFDPTSNAVVWTESTDGAAGNLVYAVLRWSSATTGNGVWTIVAPRGDEPIVRLPVLPDPALQIRGDAFGPAPLASVRVDGPLTKARTQMIGRWQPGATWPLEGDTGSVAYRDLGP